MLKTCFSGFPEEASLHNIAREIEFIAAVRQGLAELDRGERIPIEEVERELPLMDYQVVLSLSARSDLRDIVRYISIDNPDEAIRFRSISRVATRLLAQSPELGRIVPELKML